MNSSLWIPTRIRFGIHLIDQLAELRSELSGRRALLITSQSHSKTDGTASRITTQLQSMGISTEIFAGVHAEPTSDLVDSISEVRREKECDLIVALGGGSVIDVAKFVAMMATNGGRCADYETGRAVENAPLPLVAIPTTAGSGSEVTPYAVIINSQTRRKFTVSNSHFYPRCTIVDPSLASSLPSKITLASGLDAWIQALEACLSVQKNPLLDPLIENVLKAVPVNLSIALSNPENLEARSELSRASVMSGIIISHLRTGLVHTMSVALSAHVNLPHGLLNAVILPRVLGFNWENYRRERLNFVSEINLQSLSCPHDFSGHPVDSRLQSPGVAVAEKTFETKDWLKNLGVPVSLREFKLEEKIIPSLIARVRQDAGLAAVNPRPISDDDLSGLLRKVMFDE
jgi:alcohol dehydrogenase class IV